MANHVSKVQSGIPTILANPSPSLKISLCINAEPKIVNIKPEHCWFVWAMSFFVLDLKIPNTLRKTSEFFKTIILDPSLEKDLSVKSFSHYVQEGLIMFKNSNA